MGQLRNHTAQAIVSAKAHLTLWLARGFLPGRKPSKLASLCNHQSLKHEQKVVHIAAFWLLNFCCAKYIRVELTGNQSSCCAVSLIMSQYFDAWEPGQTPFTMLTLGSLHPALDAVP